MTTDALYQRQAQLEAQMSGLGVDRYNINTEDLRKKGKESGSSYGKLLMSKAVLPVTEAITRFINENTGKVGRAHRSLKYLRLMDAEIIAVLAVRTMLDNASSEILIQKTAHTIGMFLEDEYRVQQFSIQDADNYKRMSEKLKTSHRGHRKRVLSVAATASGVEFPEWPTADKVLLGLKLIDLVQQATGWFERRQITQRSWSRSRKASLSTRSYILTATPALLEWIERHKDRAELLWPWFLPTIIPPKRWTGPTGGAYHTSSLPQQKLVKTYRREFLEELRGLVDEMPVVYDAVNALQETPWRINSRVYGVVMEAWTAGLDIGEIPSAEDSPVPPKPDLDLTKEGRALWSESEADAWKEWKKEASQTHKKNIARRSRRIQFAQTIWTAGKFLDEERFYFPYQYDFRGRVYTIPTHLTPQGTDLAKGLLMFADGKPITTQEQADWLAIHGANVYGYDKASLTERVQWVADHAEEIKAVASDPTGYLDLWANSDKPWQYLAFCFEWAAFLEHGLGYISSLPVAMDGSCNGLQIFSLVLRDPVGGKATNLLPSDSPQDIYQLVADKVVTKLEDDVQRGQDQDVWNADGTQVLYNKAEAAAAWLELGIDRKMTKRPVMVLPYGGTKHSMQAYIKAALDDKLEAKAKVRAAEKGIPVMQALRQVDPWKGRHWGVCSYLTGLIWDAIGETVVAARQCMDWLQEAAREVAKEDLPVVWRTPDGFPVFQAYQKVNTSRVETKLGDISVKLTVGEKDPDRLDTKRQANGVSPNWVHSLDGCALRCTVVRAVDLGIKDFAMVHDSYGTVAADAPTLARTLRETFVDLFTANDVLLEFRAYIGDLIGEEGLERLKPLPEVGSLEVSKVLESDFFFA